MIILPALLGLALCLLKAAGVKFLCLTTGCTIYSGYSLFGLSFTIYGAIGFGVILLLTLSAGKFSRVPILLGGTILTGLILDLFFLGWQILYWPCSSCLVIALLLGGTAAGFWRRYPQLHRPLFKGIFLLWLALLIPVIAATAKEVLLPPWAIYAPADAKIHVFFSPSCPVCATEVNKLLQSPDVAGMAFYPIAKNDRDLRLLATLLQNGITQPADLGRLFLPDMKETANPPLSLRWRLARNKMALAKHGALTIPFILSAKVIDGARPPWENLFSVPGLTPASGTSGCGTFEQQESSCK